MNETKLRSDLYTSSVGLSQKHISYPNTHVFLDFGRDLYYMLNLLKFQQKKFKIVKVH